MVSTWCSISAGEEFSSTECSHRVVEEPAGEHVDGGVEGGGEQHPLPVGRGGLEQPPHDRQEAEVGHLVGLVDDHDLDVGQVALALADEVGQPAGGGDDDVGLRCSAVICGP